MNLINHRHIAYARFAPGENFLVLHSGAKIVLAGDAVAIAQFGKRIVAAQRDTGFVGFPDEVTATIEPPEAPAVEEP